MDKAPNIEPVVPTEEGSGCEETRDLLYLFVTNELDDEESQQVCTHLMACPECRTAMAEHVKLTGALKRTIPGITLRYYSSNN